MREDIKYNLNSYLQKRKKHSILVTFLFLLFITILLISITIDAYNILAINAQTVCEETTCEIVFYWQAEKPLTYDFIKINDKKVEVESINFGEVVLDNTNNAIQKVTLKGKEYQGKDNEILKIKIFQNKEKIIKKVGKIIIERET